MPAIIIRAATAADVDAVACLIERAIRVSNAPDYEPAVIERIVANFTPERVAQKMTQRDVFVAHMGQALLGSVSLGGDKLHSLFVEPSRQGKGIGRRLVDHIESHAVACGVAELRVSSSITARAFYEKLGYRLLDFEARQDGSTYLMGKRLT